jgi:glycosyltransferase involved in cell wall biosynthesis
MNILFICNEFPPGKSGGIGSATRQLAIALAAKGHRVLVAGLYQPGYGGADYEEIDGIQVWRKRIGIDGPFMQSGSIISKPLGLLLRLSGLARRSTKMGLSSFLDFLGGLVAKYHVDIIEWPDFNEWFRFQGIEAISGRLKVPVVVKLHGTDSYIQHQLGPRLISAF